jgi:hypothetical protein
MSKLYELGSLIIITVVVGICLIAGLTSTLFLGDDNPIEEIAEQVIEKETGQDVDLTPSSPEKKA